MCSVLAREILKHQLAWQKRSVKTSSWTLLAPMTRQGLTNNVRGFATKDRGDAVSKSNTWGRVTLTLHQNDMSSTEENYLRERASSVDPAESVLSLQQEVQEEIAAALGRSGSKLTTAMKEMHIARELFEAQEDSFLAARSKGQTISFDAKRDLLIAARKFNDKLQIAEDARTALMVHRQAVGFVYQNHKIVKRAYPLPDLITRYQFRNRYFDTNEIDDESKQ